MEQNNIIKALRLAQNRIAAGADMCDEDELILWNIYGSAIDEVKQLLEKINGAR